MKTYWCCTCRYEWEVYNTDLRLGSIVECPSCNKIWAQVRRKRGDTIWVPLDREMANSPYYGLLTPLDED